MKAFEQFQPAPAQSPGEDRFLTSEKAAEMDQPLRQPTESPLKGVRTNIVQSIRAFRVPSIESLVRVRLSSRLHDSKLQN